MTGIDTIHEDMPAPDKALMELFEEHGSGTGIPAGMTPEQARDVLALAGLITDAAGTLGSDLPSSLARFDPVAGVQLDEHGNPIIKKSTRQGRSISRADFKLDTRSVFEKDPTLLGPVVTRDTDGELVSHGHRRKGFETPPRKLYHRGTFWRVAGENVRMEAMCNYGNGANGKPIWSGWSRLLPVGTVVECIGWRKYRGTVAPMFTYPELPAEAKVSSVWPHDGVWRPWPLAGILVPATAEERQAYLERAGRADG